MVQMPKFDPANRAARVGPQILPLGGRKGAPPEWPLDDPPSAAEAACWADLWATPQAVVWERMGCVRVVARFCRMSVLAEQPDAKAAMHAQATALADRLGLTPKAMRALLWAIAPEEAPPVPPERRQRVRDRLKAVS